jgi:hypothetical protein
VPNTGPPETKEAEGLISGQKGSPTLLTAVFYCTQDVEAGHWWLMSIILATQEAEIRRIVVQS